MITHDMITHDMITDDMITHDMITHGMITYGTKHGLNAQEIDSSFHYSAGHDSQWQDNLRLLLNGCFQV